MTGKTAIRIYYIGKFVYGLIEYAMLVAIFYCALKVGSAFLPGGAVDQKLGHGAAQRPCVMDGTGMSCAYWDQTPSAQTESSDCMRTWPAKDRSACADRITAVKP